MFFIYTSLKLTLLEFHFSSKPIPFLSDPRDPFLFHWTNNYVLFYESFCWASCCYLGVLLLPNWLNLCFISPERLLSGGGKGRGWAVFDTYFILWSIALHKGCCLPQALNMVCGCQAAYGWCLIARTKTGGLFVWPSCRQCNTEKLTWVTFGPWGMYS